MLLAPRQPHQDIHHPPHYPPTTTTARHSRAPASAPPPQLSASSSSRPSERPRLQSLPAQAPAPPPPTETRAPAPAEPAKPKSDKAKLTEQWGPPPEQIKRDKDWLQRGQLLGEGGFARVYLSTEPDGSYRALKVIAKEQLKSTKNKSKLFGEIKIHQAMQHANIISFEHCFEDDRNVYMQLELCANGSLLDLLRKRRRYSEPEARFYLVQLIGACDYMHSNSVIHRDLKLGNLMLDADMNLRVGDFGLAALVKFPGERKKTICGTPNYIAPEILFDTTNGHSFEVDIWSIGVILYTLLVGKPPFQTKDVKSIYRKIKENAYEFPPSVSLSPEAVDLISIILTTQPDHRPTLAQILEHPFFTTGPFPASISPSSLTTEPDYRHMSIRAAHRNFKTVKAMCGITEVPAGEQMPMRPTPLAPVEEEEEVLAQSVAREQVPVQQKQQQEKRRIVSGGVPMARTAQVSTKEARGMDKEVQQVLAPDSPISELLRSARKPLMVSPNHGTSSVPSALSSHEPRELLQRRLVAEATKSSSASIAPTRTSSKENSAPSVGAAVSKHRRSVLGGSAVAALSPSRTQNGLGGAGATTTASGSSKLASSTAPRVEPVSTRYPARELYDNTWRTLDYALRCTSSADLLASLPLSTEPVAPPRVFVASWVDYTHKYGTAYSLTDGTAGLYFNDSTTMVLSPDKAHFDYIANSAGRKLNVYQRRHHSLASPPTELERKVYLLSYFEEYMAKTLTRDVEWTWVDSGRKKNMDFLVKYYRMKNAIVFKMSNEVLQFNFYDHTKLLLTQSGTNLTFIDGDFQLHSYSLSSLFLEAAKLGHYSSSQPPSKALEKVRFLINKLGYCRDVIKSLASRKTTTSAA